MVSRYGGYCKDGWDRAEKGNNQKDDNCVEKQHTLQNHIEDWR